jgi:hypothetical protein
MRAGDGSEPPLLVMHIPKTAGTSLLSIVERQYAPDELVKLYPGHPHEVDAFVAHPRPARAIMGHFRFGLHERLAAGGRYVTFLRDPVDHVISMFNYLATSAEPEHRAQLGPDDTLEHFLVHPWALNFQAQYLCAWTPEAIAADPDAALARALGNLDAHFAAVGLVEWFLESIAAMTPRLGWRPVAIEKLNETPRGPRTVRRAELSGHVIRTIEYTNRCDCRLYEAVSERFWRSLAAGAPASGAKRA